METVLPDGAVPPDEVTERHEHACFSYLKDDFMFGVITGICHEDKLVAFFDTVSQQFDDEEIATMERAHHAQFLCMIAYFPDEAAFEFRIRVRIEVDEKAWGSEDIKFVYTDDMAAEGLQFTCAKFPEVDAFTDERVKFVVETYRAKLSKILCADDQPAEMIVCGGNQTKLVDMMRAQQELGSSTFHIKVNDEGENSKSN
jgi:hypothetical protein